MKIEKTVEDGFKPIKLTITLENIGEARAFYAIFNHTHNASLFGPANSGKIRTELADFEISGLDRTINNGFTYRDYFKPL